jgi:uncharacterized RDD family membrane protein YckC
VWFWSLLQLDLPFVEFRLVVFWLSMLALAVILSALVFPGQSPGKAIARLVVLSTKVGELSRPVQVLREVSRLASAMLLAIFFVGAGIGSLAQAFAMSLAVVACVELLTQALRADRKSLSDLLFHTRVVSLPPVQPHRAPAAPMYSASDQEFGRQGRGAKRDA